MTIATYRTRDGDMLDMISFSHYRDEHAIIQIMQANPQLSLNDLVLDSGILITLPDLTIEREPVLSLWD